MISALGMDGNGACHFDVLPYILFDIFDIYARWVFPDTLSKRVILFLKARKEVLYACEHCPSKYLEFTPMGNEKDGRRKDDSRSLGASTA